MKTRLPFSFFLFFFLVLLCEKTNALATDQRLGELQAISTQALMEGEEVPPALQQERKDLETAIADLGRAVKALKASLSLDVFVSIYTRFAVL